MLEVIRMIAEFTMLRWNAFCLLCLIITVPLYAQDDTLTPYEIALQRIESAHDGLDLGQLGLTEVPPEIGQLSNLRVLSLSFNQLTTLPPEIGQLSNLQHLYLGQNQLTTLPPEIGQLSNLRVLSLHFNQLTTLPPEIGQLSNLHLLYLSNNQLTNLPLEIGQLSNLKHLSVGSNQLTTLPPEIGQLVSLCYLDLRNNYLNHLPTTMGNLYLFSETVPCSDVYADLVLDENPFISPPLQVVEQGTAAVLDYLRNQAWYHTQRLIIGAAGSVGLFVLLLLGFRWKQGGGRKIKAKRG
jgi:hypothetical protein